MTVATFFGVVGLVMASILLAAAFGWAEIDLRGLSGFREYLNAVDPEPSGGCGIHR